MPEAATLQSAWAATVAARPRALALIEGASGRAWTREQLDSAARALAPKLGAAERRRVCFSKPNGADWFTVYLGLLLSGATPVPLDPSEPAANQLALARNSRAAFIWIDGELVPVPEVRRLRSQVSSLSPLATALVKLTSGSSGVPKALPFSHAQLLADGRQICATMAIGPGDRNLAVVPFGHSYGFGNLVVPLLAQGTAIVCADTPLPHALSALSAAHAPTVFPAVPALLRALAEADLPADAFASLRIVVSAGAPLPAATARLFFRKFGLKPHGFYGSSETGGISYDREGDDTLEGTSVGRALDGVSIVQLPRDRIRVRGPAVARAAGQIPADRARLGPDGRLVLLGRAGRMIKIGGRRLDLGDLEAALRRIPGVGDAFAAPHPDDPEQLAAAVVTSLGPLPLRALLREHLAAWKIPRRLVPLPAFPLTARGKPDTAALRALLRR